MGRRRSKDLNLPPRMYRKVRAFYYVRFGIWEALGSDYGAALDKWSLLEKAATEGTLSALLARYYTWPGFKSLALNTRKSYESMGRSLLKSFGDAPLSTMTREAIVRWRDWHKKPPRCANELGFLKLLFLKAKDWGMVDKNPAEDVGRPRLKSRDRYITDAEYLSIRNAVPEYVAIAMDLSYLTGARIGEVLNIRLQDVQDALTIRSSKTGKEIPHTIDDALQAVIDRAKGLPRPVRGMHLLSTKRGKPYAHSSIYAPFKRACEALGIEDVHFHDIRAKAASDDQETAQKRLGHQDGRMTARYIRKAALVGPLKQKIVERSKKN